MKIILKYIDRSIIFFVLFVVGFSPLPLGSNRPEIWSLFFLLIGILGFMRLAIINSRKEPFFPGQLFLLPLCCAVTTVGFVFIQSLDLTPYFHRLLESFWRTANISNGPGSRLAISINPEKTLAALLKYISYLVLFWLAFTMSRSKRQTWRQIELICWFGFAYSLYGLIEYFSGNQHVLWFEKEFYRGDLTSVFINRNSYATYAGLILICSVTVFLRLSRRLEGKSFSHLVSMPNAYLWRLYIISVAIIGNATAIFLTHSRGGFIATLLGLFVLFAFCLKPSGAKSKLYISAMTLLAIIFVFVTFLSSDLTIGRLLNTGLETSMRDEVYLAAIHGFTNSPALGFGYGTFEEGFRSYYTDSLGRLNWDKAHNVYIETIFELGFIFGTIFFIPYVWLLIHFIKIVKNRKKNLLLASLGLAALTLSGIHSMVDFSHQIPAVSILFCWLLGIICGTLFGFQSDSKTLSRLHHPSGRGRRTRRKR